MGVKTLTENANEVIIISTNGQTIRLGLKDIPELGRATQGVRIMRLNEGDTVASLALIDTSLEGETEEVEEDDGSLEVAAPKPDTSNEADTEE